MLNKEEDVEEDGEKAQPQLSGIGQHGVVVIWKGNILINIYQNIKK